MGAPPAAPSVVPEPQTKRPAPDLTVSATAAQQSQATASAPRKKRAAGETTVGAPPAAPSIVSEPQTKRPVPDLTVSAAAAQRSIGVNNTPNHLLFFKRCSWQLIEGGGGGNCFFHSVTVINKTYRNRRPDLFKSHFALRKQICNFWISNLATLSLNGMKMADVPEMHAKIATMAKMNEDAEYEVVAAFASMIEDAVIVWNMHSELPWVMFPDGRCLRDNELLPDTLWRFWADGVHYQAVVGKGNVVMRAGKSVGDVVNIRDIVCN